MMVSSLTHICVTRPQWVKRGSWHNSILFVHNHLCFVDDNNTLRITKVPMLAQYFVNINIYKCLGKNTKPLCSIFFHILNQTNPAKYNVWKHVTTDLSFKLIFYAHFVLLSFKFQRTNHLTFLHMSRQLCCRDMCKIVGWWDGQELNYQKTLFPYNWNSASKIVSEMDLCNAGSTLEQWHLLSISFIHCRILRLSKQTAMLFLWKIRELISKDWHLQINIKANDDNKW